MALGFLAAVLTTLKATGSTNVPTLVSISPQPGSRIKAGEEIRITFAQPPAPIINRISLKTTPPRLEIEKKAQGMELMLFPKYLPETDRYFFELQFDGRPLYSWSYFLPPLSPTPFPKPTPTVQEATPSASPELGDPKIVREMSEVMSKNFPLIKHVPYSNGEFAINYLAPLKLGVKIKTKDKESVKENVLEWIKSKGVNPDTHEIVWL